MAQPAASSGGLHGPFTHWHPNGAVESHGRYVEDGATSVPDGVWGFWYPDGAHRSVGRYERGQPVGCFAMWDEQGVQVTGVVEGDQLRVERCDPPEDDELNLVEARSHPSATRAMWGDASLHGVAGGGVFGASNATQRDPDPASRATFQIAVRKHLGRFRVGPALGLRLSDSDNVRGYAASAAAGIGLPLPHPRLRAEFEAQVGVQYLDVTASRTDLPGVGSVGFWAPLGSARSAISFAVTPTFLVTAGARVEGSLGHVDRAVRYCAPFCSPPVSETWNLGGAAYGLDLGLQLLLR